MFLEDMDTSNLQFIDIQHNDDSIITYDDAMGVRLSCFAHTLQLCVRDGLKNVPYIPKILGKCQTLAKFSHKSSKMADLLEHLNKSINKMNMTRWNSEYVLIKSIFNIGKNDLEILTHYLPVISYEIT